MIIAQARSIISVLGLMGVLTLLGGCGCRKEIAGLVESPKPRDGSEKGLLLLYMDDSASIDKNRGNYGDWAIQVLRSIKVKEANDVGIHFAAFRSEPISRADLRLTGKSTIESALISYEDDHGPTDIDTNSKKKDSRDLGTSFENTFKEANDIVSKSKATSVLMVIFTDGGIEDGPNGNLKGAISQAKAFMGAKGGGSKNRKVLILGLTEDDNGKLIRSQYAFWKNVGGDYQLGKMSDTQAIIADGCSTFSSSIK